jgi:hypothetical protein
MLLVTKSTASTYRNALTYHCAAKVKKPCLAARLDLSLCCPDQETFLSDTTGLVTVLPKSTNLAWQHNWTCHCVAQINTPRLAA